MLLLLTSLKLFEGRHHNFDVLGLLETLDWTNHIIHIISYHTCQDIDYY
jgi:hypothetical protein